MTLCYSWVLFHIYLVLGFVLPHPKKRGVVPRHLHKVDVEPR